MNIFKDIWSTVVSEYMATHKHWRMLKVHLGWFLPFFPLIILSWLFWGENFNKYKRYIVEKLVGMENKEEVQSGEIWWLKSRKNQNFSLSDWSGRLVSICLLWQKQRFVGKLLWGNKKDKRLGFVHDVYSISMEIFYRWFEMCDRRLSLRLSSQYWRVLSN